jgi:hypothetical protein
MKYDSAAITTQSFTKVALIGQKIYTSVMLYRLAKWCGDWGRDISGIVVYALTD